jgi:hypothetical protein
MNQNIPKKEKKKEPIKVALNYAEQKTQLPNKIKKNFKDLKDFNNGPRISIEFGRGFISRKNHKNVSEIDSYINKYEINKRIGCVLDKSYEDDFEPDDN